MSDIALVYNFTEWKGNPLAYPHCLALIEENDNRVCIWFEKDGPLIALWPERDGVSYRFKVRLNGDEFAETRPITANEIWKEIAGKNSDAERTLYAGWMYNFSEWKGYSLYYRYGIYTTDGGEEQIWKWKSNEKGEEYLVRLRARPRGYKLTLHLGNGETAHTRAIPIEEFDGDSIELEDDSY